MNYVDSWLFLEAALKGEKGDMIFTLFEQFVEEGMATSCATLTEVKYKLLREVGVQKAEEQIQILMSLPNLIIVPVISTVALAAADLRNKYYTKERQMSFADALHLATAKELGCTALYSGDQDFKNIEEIRTVIV